MDQLLLDLSNLAKSIDTGDLTLSESRIKAREPDATMWRIRCLAHEDPELLDSIENFIRSDAPTAARLFALFSFIQPTDDRAVKMIASILRSPPNVHFANAACLCYMVGAGNGVNLGWSDLAGKYLSLGLSPAYGPGEERLVFVPGDVDANTAVFRAHTDPAKLKESAACIVSLLSQSNPELFKGSIMLLARDMLSRCKAVEEDNARFQMVVEDSYLRVDKGWQAALEILSDKRRDTAIGLAVLGQGMANLDQARRVDVLEKVAYISPGALLRPPFAEHIGPAVDYLSLPQANGGPSEGTYALLCWNLSIRSEDPDWVQRTLLEHPSSIIRRRIAISIASYANSRGVRDTDVQSVLRVCERLIGDTDFKVRLSAGHSTLQILQQKKIMLQPSECERFRSLIQSWVNNELRGQLSTEDKARLDGISESVKSLK